MVKEIALKAWLYTDWVCDHFIPVGNSITNIVDIVAKLTIVDNPNFMNQDGTNVYQTYLKDKTYTQCMISAIPIVGNFFCLAQTITQRIYSTYPTSLEKLEEESDKLAKSEGFYKCVKRTADDSGGYRYTFERNEAYKNISERVEGEINPMDYFAKISRELFPAIQPNLEKGGADVYFILRHCKTFEVLGYSCKKEKSDGDYEYIINSITLPDRITLSHRWELLRKRIPSLPPIKFVSSEGVASDKKFVKAFINGEYIEYIISSDKEFFHDQTVHLPASLAFVFNCDLLDLANNLPLGTTYKNSMQKMRGAVGALSTFLEQFENAINLSEYGGNFQIKLLSEELWACLGMLVDIITSKDHPSKFEAIHENLKGYSLEAVGKGETFYPFTNEGHPWNDYFYSRFGEGHFQISNDLVEAWSHMVASIDDPDTYTVDSMLERIFLAD
jgi:hypothetical protein